QKVLPLQHRRLITADETVTQGSSAKAGGPSFILSVPHTMRPIIPTIICAIALPVFAQEAKVSPTEELRTSVREWVETMRGIQQEENEWSRDQEVLANYKEGLEKEIADLK